MKMVSLKRSKKKKRSLRKMNAITESEPTYPWGLEVNLEDDTVDKLGIDTENINAGDTVNILCKTTVTSVSSRKNLEPGQKSRKRESITLQITDMAYGVAMK